MFVDQPYVEIELFEDLRRKLKPTMVAAGSYHYGKRKRTIINDHSNTTMSSRCGKDLVIPKLNLNITKLIKITKLMDNVDKVGKIETSSVHYP